MKKTLLCLALFGALVFSAPAGSDSIKSKRLAPRDLTLEEAVAIALRDNPDIRKAKAEIERTRGQVIEVRAQALPQIAITSAYNQTDPRVLQTGGRGGGTLTIPTAGSSNGGSGGTTGGTTTIVTGGNSVTGDKSWNVILEGKQVLYSGGQVGAALRIAKLTEDTSLYGLRTTIDQVISEVRKNFYLVLLNRALITVQQESLQLLESELKDQQNRFEAGTVPRFNVLRAEVEVANQRPALIQARNAYLIADLQLAKLLGVDYEPSRSGEPPLHPVGELAARDRSVVLNDALTMAKMRRTFLKAQRQNILVEVQQIKVALAGYQPRVDANAGYELRSSRLTDNLDDTVNGWFFGLSGTWNIFDGLATSGRVKQARARLESARVNYEDSVHQVELEVQQAYARLVEARQLIQSQLKAVEQADEALRLARERLSAGAGVQLDVLDARVALTRSQTTELQARYDLNVALAELDRVTAADTVYPDTFNDPLVHKARALNKSTSAK